MAVTLPELNALVHRCVQTKADADYDLLYDSLFGPQLFLNITLAPDGLSQTMNFTDIQGIRVVTFFLNNTGSYLNKPYGAMLWRDILTMLAKTNDVGGCQVYNDTDDWVIFRTPYLLDRLPGKARA